MFRYALSFLASLLLLIEIPFCTGFSSSKLLSSRRSGNSCGGHENLTRSPWMPERRSVHRVLLHVATDPTSASTSAGGNNNRSYDFISVEEAEEALRQERLRYQQERSELQWLLENQRQQLQDLAKKKRENEGRTRTAGTLGRDSSKRIVVRGNNAHVDIKPINSSRQRKRPNTRVSGRNRTNERDTTYVRMKRLESLLQDAIVENEKLTSQLRAQKQQYNAERKAFESELRQERNRLHSIRDELHMERAYFETSRRMLERLLEEEQQKVQELEQQLLVMINRQRQTDAHLREQQRQQYQQQTQKQHPNIQQPQHQQQGQRDHMNGFRNPQQQPQKKKRRVRPNVGFTMNINDVACPLYP